MPEENNHEYSSVITGQQIRLRLYLAVLKCECLSVTMSDQGIAEKKVSPLLSKTFPPRWILDQRLFSSSQCLRTFSSPLSNSQTGQSIHACTNQSESPGGPELLALARATGDPLLDSLPARETNQPQDPGCSRARFTTRIICLTHAPVGSADLEYSSRLLSAHQLSAATKMVTVSQRKWTQQKPASWTRRQDMEVGICEEERGPPDRIHLDTIELAPLHLNIT